jgi:hypothetical protein
MKCNLLAPFTAKCGNVAEDEIDTMPEEGVFFDGPEATALNRLTLSATFTCGTLPSSLAGEYTGKVSTLLAIKEPAVNQQIHKYHLPVAPTYGEQTLTLTIGLMSWPVVMTGDQEDKFPTRYLVVKTGS